MERTHQTIVFFAAGLRVHRVKSDLFKCKPLVNLAVRIVKDMKDRRGGMGATKNNEGFEVQARVAGGEGRVGGLYQNKYQSKGMKFEAKANKLISAIRYNGSLELCTCYSQGVLGVVKGFWANWNKVQ